ncbi:S-adenosyl-l-methionine hydroxide adenosyltransferase family protein [Nocardiopsis sediminis]|uniref:S-adenosyl-l-methionine hydroxide adenosyltransferase family protein n=1 Tax=Nocardiopsis sediminis TaxID=1778267 RepID=A0ABV8FIN3_9ACTN
MPDSTWITFLTDYGLENKFIGVCHGVIARIAPAARVLDITHLVPRGDVPHGAEVFRQAVPYLPVGVHLAVVDPGVGTGRKPVVLVAGDHLIVGPDNGMLLRAADELGGVDAAYELADPRYRLSDISTTFHGRDIFSPAAAHLAAGVAPSAMGPPIDPAGLVRLPDPVRSVDSGVFRGEVLIEDRFGNLQTSLDSAFLREGGVGIGHTVAVATARGSRELPFVETFGSVGEGEALVHIDSADRLALAVNLGSAADLFGLHERDTFTLRAV